MLDLDDVVFEFIDPLLKYYGELNGVTYEVPIGESFNLATIVGCDDDEAKMMVDRFYGTEMFRNLPFIEGAEFTIDYLSREGHEFIAVTDRHRTAMDDTFRRFEQSEVLSQVLNEGNTFFTGRFDGGNDRRRKVDICVDNSVDRVIEDNLQVVRDCAQVGISSYLFDRRWNQTLWLPDEITVVNYWDEIRKEET